jgi:hypothetical protein
MSYQPSLFSYLVQVSFCEMLIKPRSKSYLLSLICNNRDLRRFCGRVGRALALDALCRGFDPCRRRPRGVAVGFGPKQTGWLINQPGNPSFKEL